MSAARRVVSSLAWIALGIAAADLITRPLARTNLIGPPGLDHPGTAGLLGLAAAIVLLTLARGRRYRTFTIFAVLFVAGLFGQARAGARLHGDGFYYFAYLRSIVFDHDVNFDNDYRMIGLGDKPHLFVPTRTGYAQSAWAIGTAITWSPFFGAAHLVAVPLSKTRPNVTPDGSAYPYRQSVCIAGLFYGLLGAYFIMRLCMRFAEQRIAIAATSFAISGSFMFWYIVFDPSATHAPAMASTAAFAWLWVATLDGRTTWQWLALGALGGFMAVIRWQNAVYGLLPITEVAVIAWTAIRARDQRAMMRLMVHGAVGGVAFMIAFLPQMLAWKSIYGTYLAVSPIGPEMRFSDPHWSEMLWSSRNGLFAFTPILAVGAMGFWPLVRRHRLIGVAFVLAWIAALLFNSMIQDWWGSAAYGARRFEGAIPLLAVGLTMLIAAAMRVVAARPLIPAVALLAVAVVWNSSFASVMRRGAFAVGAQNDFGAVSGAQWRSLHARFGYPFSWPANLVFAWQNDVSPALYDLHRSGSFFNDPVAPLGQIDFGNSRDEMFLGAGWLPAQADDHGTYRPTARVADILLPMSRTPPVHMRIRLRAFMFDGAPPQNVAVRLNGRECGVFAVGADWQMIEFDVPASALRTTINRLILTATRGSDVAPADGTVDPVFQPALFIDRVRFDRTDIP